MKPYVGDVYCVYDEKLQGYAACQVIEIKAGGRKSQNLAALLELDWADEELPGEDEVREMKPLYADYYFWNKQLELNYVEGKVPKPYIKVGNVPPKTDAGTRGYGSWNVGSSLYRQRKWDRIPEDRRKAFKEAANDDTLIKVGGQRLRRSTHVIDDEVLQSLKDWSELDNLPCLTRIIAKKTYADLQHYVNCNPFINELQWENHGCKTIDVRHSGLERVILRAGELEELYLGPNVEELHLTGPEAAGLVVHAHEDGRWITAGFYEGKPYGRGLERLGSLHVKGIKELDLKKVIDAYPELNELRLWGKPGTIVHMECLDRLSGLMHFSTYDLFGFTGEQFPGPEKLQHLTWLWLTSLPAETAKAVKQKYKQETANGLSLAITKPRKPEWLQENMLNPFRDWDGREHITAAHAKKAAAVYKKTLAAMNSAAGNTMDGATDVTVLKQELLAIVSDYTEAFNKMDRRTGLIETVEREEIFTVLSELLQTVQNRLASANIGIDGQMLFERFDELREF